MRRAIRGLASLKLAVVIVLVLAAITAWGTIVEAEYGEAWIAQKLVFHSVWMYGTLGMLCISLIAVMADRWPWKPRHIGFILAHIGILILLFGSWVTRRYGIDGSLAIDIGSAEKFVRLSETDLTVYTSLDGSQYRKVYDREVDYFGHPPTSPQEIPLGDAKLEVIDYMPFALREQKLVSSEATTDGPAVRFQLQNPNVNMTEWLHQAATGREALKDLGPAKVVLTQGDYDAAGQNAIVLRPRPDGESLSYEIWSRRDQAGQPQEGPATDVSERKSASLPGHSKAPKGSSSAKRLPSRQGIVKAGDVIETGWMGLVMRVLKYMPHAKEEVLFHKRERPTPLTTAAIKVRFNGEEKWASINSLLKLFTDQAVYIVAYAHRRIDLAKVMEDPGFIIQLKKFEVGRYQGTNRAATYQSLVTVPGRGDVLISMNEPMDHKGFTFYQASFVDGEDGRPVTSVLSVNKDPGRWLKYLGSLLIVLGSIQLFYFKKMAAKRSQAAGVPA